MTTGINDTFLKTVCPVMYAGAKAVDYAKEVKEITDTIPKKEASVTAKVLAPLFTFGYENSDKIEVAAKKVSTDIKKAAKETAKDLKENAKQNVEKYKNSSTTVKFLMGLPGAVAYHINKFVSEQ